MPDITFSQSDQNRVEEFVAAVAPHTYKRLSRSVEEEKHLRRIRVGKYGELAFRRFLEKNGRQPLGAEDMFTVWEGTKNVDVTDFTTDDGRKVDTKTASESYHRLIIVPEDQYLNQPKDYYVGVRIDLPGLWANIAGFATYHEMGLSGVQNRGEGPGYERRLIDLRPIAGLLAQFPPAHGR